MRARFFAPDAAAPGDVVPLPADEAHHLARVMRLKTGNPIVVINGRGGAFDAVIVSTGRDVAVRVGGPAAAAPEPRVAVTLAQAALKGDKMDDVVRDAVMIGVAAVQPIVTTRSEVTSAALQRGGRRARWERVAVASAKQCGRAVVPAVHEPIAFDELVPAVAAMRLPGVAWMLVEPVASADTISIGDVDATPPREAMVVVGPEGGWTADEIATGAAACRLLRIGGRTLRADAAAMVAIAALFTRWKEL